MLSWIWRRGRPAAPSAAVASHGAVPRREALPAAPLPERPAGAGAPLFFEQLSQEHPPVPPVAEEDEQNITALVLDMVALLAKKKLDPPVMPALVPRVLAIVNQAEVDLEKLTHVIEQDLALGAKLLSVSNSSMFGAKVEIRSVKQAVAYLGTEQVAQLAIGLACRSSFAPSGRDASPFTRRWNELFRHGVTCAFAASDLAARSGKGGEDSAFLGGLFHDVGKAVALRALELLARDGRLVALSEGVIDEALYRVHAYPGDEFYDKWTLPSELMDLCALHHQLDDLEPSRTFSQVALTSCFAALLSGTPADRRDALAEARVSADRLGLSEEALRAAYTQTRASGERAARMISG